METSEEVLDLCPEPADPRFLITQLTPADVLKRKGEGAGAVVIRQIWLQPHFIGSNTYPDFKCVGFTLFDTLTLTDREATAEEVQHYVDDGSLIPLYPHCVRTVPSLKSKVNPVKTAH